MSLLTQEQREQLLANGRRQALVRGTEADLDPLPVVKLFTPDEGATWLLTEIDPDDPEIAFGLCDLGLGYPELGYVSLAEIASVRGCLGLAVEQDRSFRAIAPLSAYAAAANEAERIVEQFDPAAYLERSG